MNPMTHAEALKALFLEGSYLDLTDRHAAQYALGLAGRIEWAAQTLIDSMVTGIVVDEPLFSDEPFHDDIARTIAARKAREFKVGDRGRINPNARATQMRGEVVVLAVDTDHTPYYVRLTQGAPGYESRTGECRWLSADELIPADTIPVATPEEDEQMDEIEARQVEASHPAPNFAPLDMVSFAADSLGLRKGA